MGASKKYRAVAKASDQPATRPDEANPEKPPKRYRMFFWMNRKTEKWPHPPSGYTGGP
jgi:hypothetical protein